MLRIMLLFVLYFMMGKGSEAKDVIVVPAVGAVLRREDFVIGMYDGIMITKILIIIILIVWTWRVLTWFGCVQCVQVKLILIIKL